MPVNLSNVTSSYFVAWTLNVGDAFIILLAQEKADISDLKIVTVDESKEIIGETDSESSETFEMKDLASDFELYVFEGDGYYFLFEGIIPDSVITLNEDGTGHILIDGEDEELK